VHANLQVLLACLTQSACVKLCEAAFGYPNPDRSS
jgi:hypothetical protein